MIPACTLELVKESLRTDAADRADVLLSGPLARLSGIGQRSLTGCGVGTPSGGRYDGYMRPGSGGGLTNSPLAFLQLDPPEPQPAEKVIGILFVRLGHQKEYPAIFLDLPDFHLRSGPYVDFFLPGYGTDWDDNYAPDRQEVARIDGVSWYHSPTLYAKFQEELEHLINWEPTGGCELLLLSVDTTSLTANEPIRFDKAIDIDITELISAGLVTSIANLFYRIFNLFRKNDRVTLGELSNLLAKKNGEKALLDFLGVIPGAAGPIKSYERLKPYAVKSIGIKRSAS